MCAHCSFGERFYGYDKHWEACADSADAGRAQKVSPQRLSYSGSGEGAASDTSEAASARRDGQCSGSALARNRRGIVKIHCCRGKDGSQKAARD